MKVHMETDSQTILLEGTIEKPTPRDMERVQKIRDELRVKHDHGLIVHRSSKRSKYKKLTIEWRSKPDLVPNG